MPVRTRSLPAALTAAALAAVLAGCGGGGGGAAPPPAPGGGPTLVAEGQLTTCTSLPYEPFQFSRDGAIVGFDVDMVDLVATKLGVKQQIVETPFDGIQSGAALDSGQCDLGAAAMTITDARKQNIDFSEPYFDASQALLVKKDSGITDTPQLAGKRLGVQNSTTGQEYAQTNIQGAEFVVFEDLGLLLTAVQTGQVDAGINDNGPLLDFVDQEPGPRRHQGVQHRGAVRVRGGEGQHRAGRGHQLDHHRGEVQRHLRHDLPEVVREGPGPELTP